MTSVPLSTSEPHIAPPPISLRRRIGRARERARRVGCTCRRSRRKAASGRRKGWCSRQSPTAGPCWTAEVPGHGGSRDREGGVGHHDHQQAQAEHEESPPAPGVGLVHPLDRFVCAHTQGTVLSYEGPRESAAGRGGCTERQRMEGAFVRQTYRATKSKEGVLVPRGDTRDAACRALVMGRVDGTGEPGSDQHRMRPDSVQSAPKGLGCLTGWNAAVCPRAMTLQASQIVFGEAGASPRQD